MDSDSDREGKMPEPAQVIEPETMSETEVRDAKENADSARRSRRVFIQETPYGPYFTHIEIEGYGEDSFGAGGPFIMPKPPTFFTWLALVAAWFFLGSSLPFTVLIGLPLNVAALVLALVCLTRGGIVTGIVVLLLGTVGSLLVYLVGLARFAGGMLG